VRNAGSCPQKNGKCRSASRESQVPLGVFR
jgi:hypothetical protein